MTSKPKRSPLKYTDKMLNLAGASGRKPRVEKAATGAAALPSVFYEKCVVSFIDILGFKEVVEQRSADEVYQIMQLFKRHSDPEEEKIRSMDEARMTSRAWAQSVSDAIVRVRTADTQYRDGAFVRELLDLVHIQIELVNRGVLVRAGTTVGKVCVGIDGEHTFFGLGINRAYEIESKEAIFPRIVIDDAALALHTSDESLRSEDNSLEDELKIVNALVAEGEDGTRFIDYLAAVDEFDHPALYLEFLQRHAELIRKGRAEGGDVRKRRKFEWLARYHNARVRPMMAATLQSEKRKTDFLAEYEADAEDYFKGIIV